MNSESIYLNAHPYHHVHFLSRFHSALKTKTPQTGTNRERKPAWSVLISVVVLSLFKTTRREHSLLSPQIPREGASLGALLPELETFEFVLATGSDLAVFRLDRFSEIVV